MNKQTWIAAVLSNDENSTDKELIAYFIENGLTIEEACKAVENRADYLNGIL